MSTIILKVDLECCKCNKKIRRVLCELQEKWKIQTIVYDEKNGTVTISGPFDPDKLCKKLCYKACNIILNIEIKKPDPPKPDPPPAKPDPSPTPEPPAPAPEPAPAPAPEPAPAPAAAPAPEPAPAPAPEPAPAPAPIPEPAPAPIPEPAPAPAPEPAKEPPKQAAPPEEPKPAPPVMQVAWQYGPVVPACCCMYHGMCRCCSCGRSAGWGPAGAGYECKTYELVSEEDPSCTIM